MERTRGIDFERISLRDALDLAVLIEQEAKERYEEFSHQMRTHHNEEAAHFFERMVTVESTHESYLAARRRSLFGDAPSLVGREMLFDVEAPEYDEVDAPMTVREALHAALRAEQKAFAFFDGALRKVIADDVRDLFVKLREEELEHRHYVERELARLTPESPIDARAFEDEPNPQ
jgi:erythrin-vacuolar iron transport family protein